MKRLGGANEISLNDLPSNTDWIPYLLNLKNLSKTLDKNPQSIAQEYGVDKWGALLENLNVLENPTVEDADKLFNKKQIMPFYFNGRLFSADSTLIQDIYFDLIKNELQADIQQFGHLVELGAGYGSIILKLAKLFEFKDLGYTAGEFTASGVDCIKLLASNLNGAIEVGFCDLSDLKLECYRVPKDAVFMTCWTVACLKGFSRSTLNEIIRHNPSVVIHIEPTFEHWSDNSLLHLLWQRYFQLNDYNQSYLSALRQYEKEGLIRIVEEKRNIFGANPLAPISIVKWVTVK